mmetsp:Transcript_48773/g.110685  ORF Transcript_48773/g.110685 Transcript_48773/m.110685 type:complete len:167 (-) Transcript_48773:228-728(-)
MSNGGVSRNSRRVTSSALEKSVPANVIDTIQDVFNHFDTDLTGSVSRDEMGSALGSMGMSLSEDELTELMREADEDESGTIELEEFVNIVLAYTRKNADPQESLLHVFDTFDVDADGLISAYELQNILAKHGEKLTMEEIDQLIATYDRDCDGKLNWEEFCSIFFH